MAKVMLLVVAPLGLALLGCSSVPNARSCLDGTCGDPRFPFCDVNGTLGGVAGECIAVTCEPDSFAECRDNVAVTCNANGDNYVTETCDRECTEFGCKLCNPNETACSNGVVATCDANGQIASRQDCPLGCAGAEARCLHLVPSNRLAEFAPPDAFVSDLDFTGVVTINVNDGSVVGAAAHPSVLIPAAAGGLPIRVFYGRRIRLGDVTFKVSSSPTAAIAFYAGGELSVEGALLLDATVRTDGREYADPACIGGFVVVGGTEPSAFASGGGGGGFGTAGGAGGVLQNSIDSPGAGAPGAVSGNETLVPLRGGCGGYESTGGGAIQLSSDVAVRVSTQIDARGSAGLKQRAPSVPPVDYAGGGGAGGGILLEAPVVEIGATARLLASGGSGASYENSGGVGPGTQAAIGGPCMFANCGKGGDAAFRTTPAESGGSANAATPGPVGARGGGGGGGLGRIRINTGDGSFVTAPSTVIDGAITQGTIVAR